MRKHKEWNKRIKSINIIGYSIEVYAYIILCHPQNKGDDSNDEQI